MTNGLRVNDIAPVGERPSDIIRGRVGIQIAGVGTMLGSPLNGTPTLAGDFWVYDPATDSWLIVNTSSIGAGLYVTRTEGGQDRAVITTASGAAVTIDCSQGNLFDITLTANCTLTITNAPAATDSSGHVQIGQIGVILRQGGSGSYTVTFPASVKWAAADGTNGGSAPALFTVVGAQDDVVLSTIDGGTTWGGTHLSAAAVVTGFATPAVVLGTAAAVGAATTTIRSDSTIAAFDTTVPVTQALGDAAATGSIAFAARRDHKHGMPALSSATPLIESGAGSVGTAVPSSREDHVHPAFASTGSSDHEHIGSVEYNGDGSTTAFELPAAPFDAYSVVASVAGVIQDVTLSGTMLTTMTFASAPASGTNNVRVDIVAVAV